MHLIFRKRVLIDKNSYLKTELIQDIHEVSIENGLQDAFIKRNHFFLKKICGRIRKFYWILYCW